MERQIKLAEITGYGSFFGLYEECNMFLTTMLAKGFKLDAFMSNQEDSHYYDVIVVRG